MTDELVRGFFDLTEWKKTGEIAYEELCEEERTLIVGLEEIRKKKSELAKVLGKISATTRSRIRPSLIELLETYATEGLDINEVCSRLIEKNTKLTEKSIRTSLGRLAKESDQVVISGETVTFSLKKTTKAKKL